MTKSRVQHIMRLAVQDWRTSRVRARSARTNDPMLRLVYLESLIALYEFGGELPADPDSLADVLLLPSEDIARCLPILAQLGETGRGGLVREGDQIVNQRVREDLEHEQRFREQQADLGRRGGIAKASLSDRQADAKGSLGPPAPVPAPAPYPEPAPFPAPFPAPAPIAREPWRPADDEIAPAFARLWSLWRRPTHQPQAQRAFVAAIGRLPEPATLFAAVEAWNASDDWTEENGKFVPKLDKWLDRGGWNETPRSPAKRKNSRAIERIA